MTLLTRFGPLVLRGLLTAGNALAVLLLIAFWIGGNHFLLHSLAVLLAVVNAVAWPCELVASFWLKSQPASLAATAIAASHPAAKFAALAAKTVDALLNFQITATEAEGVLVPAVKSLATDAEQAAPDVLGKLKQEAAQ